MNVTGSSDDDDLAMFLDGFDEDLMEVDLVEEVDRSSKPKGDNVHGNGKGLVNRGSTHAKGKHSTAASPFITFSNAATRGQASTSKSKPLNPNFDLHFTPEALLVLSKEDLKAISKAFNVPRSIETVYTLRKIGKNPIIEARTLRTNAVLAARILAKVRYSPSWCIMNARS